MRAGIGVALWVLLIASFLFLGFQWNRLRHRQAALNYLRARDAKIEIEQESPGWFSLAPILGKDALLKVRSIRFDAPGAVDVDLVQVAAFGELSELSLINSDVSDECAPSLGQLQNLSSLNLAGTRFGDAGLAQLRPRNLRSLDLSRTYVSDAGIATVAQWNMLSHLRLHSVVASDEVMARLARLPRLTELDLSYTDAGEATLGALSRHSQLSILHLNGCPIADQDLELVANCPSLVVLSLEETGVSDVGISRLSTCPALVRLVLNGTRVTDRALQALRPMTSLIHIEAKQTAISQGALDQFHGRHSKLRKPTPALGSNSSFLNVP